MIKTRFDDDINQLADLAKHIKQASEQQSQPLLSAYLDRLNHLMGNGWHYALGSDNEIDKALLPEHYLLQRKRTIQRLQLSLGACAMEYRSTGENSPASDKAIADYHGIYRELVRISGEILALDPDAELPDELMPADYVQFWLNSI